MTAAPQLGSTLMQAAPAVSTAEAARLAARLLGQEMNAVALAGERDRNFRLSPVEGGPCLLLKVVHPQEPTQVTRVQTAALVAARAGDHTLPVAELAAPVEWVALDAGPRSAVRITTFLAGRPLADLGPIPVAQARALGVLLARFDRALADFAEPVAAHPWDTTAVLQNRDLRCTLTASHPDLREVLETSASAVHAAMPDLVVQAIHNDANPHNVIALDQGGLGLIDIGDLARAPRIQEVAVAAAYLIVPDGLDAVAALVGGYEATSPLSAGERAVLYDLVVARLALAMALTGHRAAQHPDNAGYILRNYATTRQGWDVLMRCGRAEFDAAVAGGCARD